MPILFAYVPSIRLLDYVVSVKKNNKIKISNENMQLLIKWLDTIFFSESNT